MSKDQLENKKEEFSTHVKNLQKDITNKMKSLDLDLSII